MLLTCRCQPYPVILPLQSCSANWDDLWFLNTVGFDFESMAVLSRSKSAFPLLFFNITSSANQTKAVLNTQCSKATILYVLIYSHSPTKYFSSRQTPKISKISKRFRHHRNPKYPYVMYRHLTEIYPSAIERPNFFFCENNHQTITYVLIFVY